MEEPFTLGQAEARADWITLARELAEGAVLPPSSLIKALAAAAGEVPAGVSPGMAFRATADLIKELQDDGMYAQTR